MTSEEIQKLVDEKVAAAKADWMKTRGWRHDRWTSIKADPQAAACMFLAGAFVWQFVGPSVLKLVGL